MLTRLPVARETRNELWLLKADGSTHLVKVYIGADAESRRDCEENLLRYWARLGYATPEVFDVSLPQFDRPYLVMSFVDAPSLRDLLSNIQMPIDQRLSCVRRVLKSVSQRHGDNDLRLVRDDANTGNFLIRGEDIVHIDLERLPHSRDRVDAAAVELAKLLRWIVRDLGRNHLDAILKLAIDAYGDKPVIPRRIIARTCDRPWQMIHRLLDRRRKAHPGAITKYDIADGLQRLFV